MYARLGDAMCAVVLIFLVLEAVVGGGAFRALSDVQGKVAGTGNWLGTGRVGVYVYMCVSVCAVVYCCMCMCVCARECMCVCV
jgi:hypothetical protein